MASIRPADDNEIFDIIKQQAVAGSRTALPGVIQSFDPDAVTCVVQICGKDIGLGPWGSIAKPSSLDYHLLVDVPVIFPRGGGVTLTFPVADGDECLVIFADRCIDFWWQSGGVQEHVDWRSHDLSDAFVIPGPQSQAHKISGISTSAAATMEPQLSKSIRRLMP